MRNSQRRLLDAGRRRGLIKAQNSTSASLPGSPTAARPTPPTGERNGQIPTTRQQGSSQAEGAEAGRRSADIALRPKELVRRRQPAKAKGLKRRRARLAAADAPPARLIGFRWFPVGHRRGRTRRGLRDGFPQRVGCAAMKASSIMQYLGRIAGSGLLTRDGKTVARTSYDFEGFSRQRGVVVSSGEISLSPSDLKTVFGRTGVQLLTDDGRLLDLRFSNREPRYAEDVALVEVSGDLPDSPAEWRRGSSAAPGRPAAPGGDSSPSSRSEKPASNSARRRRVSA